MRFGKYFAAALTAGVLLALSAPFETAVAQGRFVQVTGKVDKTQKARTSRGLLAASDIVKLAKLRFVNLDLRISLDGKDRFAVLTSVEGANRRFPVRCGNKNFGRQTMGNDIEYYVQTKQGGKQYRVSLYPGARSEHPFNDVSCVKGTGGAQADLRFRGYFFVVTNETPKSVDLQLRPIKPLPSEIR